MNLAELAVRSLEVLVKSAPPFMMMEPQYEDVNLLLVATLCEVVEQKQMKKLKYAKPALKHFETLAGGAP